MDSLTSSGSIQAGIALCKAATTDSNSMNACFTNVTTQYLLTQCTYLDGNSVPSTDPNYIAWQDYQTSNTTIYSTYLSTSSAPTVLASANLNVAAGPTITDLSRTAYIIMSGSSINPQLGPVYYIVTPTQTPPIQVGQVVNGDIIPGGPSGVNARVIFVGPYTPQPAMIIEDPNPNDFLGGLISVSPGPQGNSLNIIAILYPIGTPAFSPTNTSTSTSPNYGFGQFTSPLVFQAGTVDPTQPTLDQVIDAYIADTVAAFQKFISVACPLHFQNYSGTGNQGCVYKQWTTDPSSTSIFRWNAANITLQRFMNWANKHETDTDPQNFFTYVFGPGTIIPSSSTGIPVSLTDTSCSGTVGSNGVSFPPTNWLQ